ncbi:beta-galactosidase [Desulforhopalus sp. 52FAK]
MIGVYYYPEQWPEAQWERDIQNISKCGMKHIHLAEFSWIHLQPNEDEFDFHWLNRAIDLADKHNLKVVLCTPTATPPIWMTKNHPEILMVKETGARVTHGSRAHRCVNSEKFRMFSERIATEMAKRYGQHPAVIGWQIDNEIGHYENGGCYCNSCQQKFTHFLKNKYKNIEELNKNWAGDFWSQNYQSFEQIELPNAYALPYLPNEHALLDFKRFFSLSLSDYLEDQSEILRKHINEKMWITHNFMKDDPHHFAGHVKSGLDLYTLTIYPVAGLYHGQQGRELHRIGDPYNIAFNHDKTRSHNGRWGIMEQQPGQVNWGPHNVRPYPGSTRLWLWTAIAHGAEFLDTYRYRQPLGGSEQYHEGITTLDGVGLSPGGQDFIKTAEELQSLEELLNSEKTGTACHTQNRIALCIDWDSLTALSIHPQSELFSPHQCLEYFYRGCKRLGLEVDIIYPENIEQIFSYELTCVVLVDLASDHFVDTISRYVAEGGHTILSPRNFSRLTNGHFPEIEYSQRFEQLTGCVFQGYDVMIPGHKGKIDLPADSKSITWQAWAEQVLPPDNSEIFALHADQFYQGQTASFTMKKGKGRISYIGFAEKEGVATLMERYIKYTFPKSPVLPDNTLFTRQGFLGFFLNYNDHGVTLPAEILKNGKLLLGERQVGPADLAIVQYPL